MAKYIKEEGYKSFTKDLTSHFTPWTNVKGVSPVPVQYSFGNVFHKPYKTGILEGKDGFHFSKTITGATKRFPGDDNRICLIKCLGKTQHTSYESITQAFIIVRELSKEEVKNHIETERLKALRQQEIQNLNLILVKRIQETFPLSIVGGSVALFLHGIRLKRFTHNTSDIDLIIPFYMPFVSGNGGMNIERDYDNERTSGADFEEVLKINGVSTDVRIDNKCPYEIIKFSGFDFKVVKLEHIMEAKWRYAISGSKKHLSDCYEISGKKDIENYILPDYKEQTEADQLPF